MGKNQYHTNVECAQIVALHKIGLSQCQISKQIGVNRSSIQKAIIKSSKVIHSKSKKNLPQKEFMVIGKRVVGHEKQLHEMTIPSRGS